MCAKMSTRPLENQAMRCCRPLHILQHGRLGCSEVFGSNPVDKGSGRLAMVCCLAMSGERRGWPFFLRLSGSSILILIPKGPRKTGTYRDPVPWLQCS